MVLASVATKAAAGVVFDRMLESLHGPFFLKHYELHIGMSFGVAFFPDDGDNLEDLLRCADQVLYQTKNQERNTSQFYHSRGEASG